MPAEVTLPSDREVRVTRLFNAPRQLVWDAHTRPELAPQWLGYDGWDMPVCDMDVRVGGTYRWQWRNREDGKAFGFFGTFTEVNSPSRLVHDEYYDPGEIGGAMPAGSSTTRRSGRGIASGGRSKPWRLPNPSSAIPPRL